MVRKCKVCGKMYSNFPNLSFHRFPLDIERRNIWLSILNLVDAPEIPRTAYICSDHFDPKDFGIRRNGGKYLKNEANPVLERELFEMSSPSSSDDETLTAESDQGEMYPSDSSTPENFPECRKKWKLVRDCYNRFKRQQAFSSVPLEPAKNSKWRLYQRLGFLETITKPERPNIQIVEIRTKSPIELMQVKEEPYFPDDALSVDVEPKPETPTPSDSFEINTNFNQQASSESTRERTQDDFSLEPSPMQVLTPSQESSYQPEDEITSFSKYIEMTLRNLGAHSRALAKSEIFIIISKYELKELAEKNARYDYSSSMSNTSGSSTLDGLG